MNSETNVKVLEILEEDPYLIGRWRELADNLGIKKAIIHKLKRSNNCDNSTMYETLSDILENWTSQKGSEATLEELSKILLKTGFANSAEKVQQIRPLEENPDLKETKTCSTGGVSYTVGILLCITVVIITLAAMNGVPRSPNIPSAFVPLCKTFTGRVKELNKLTQIFEDMHPRIVVISGLGGVGKTELTRKFLSQLSGNHNITWLSGESANTLRGCIIRILEDSFGIFNISGLAQFKSRELVQKMVQKLINKVWIVIIDNVDHINNEFQELITELLMYPQSFVIITSRRKGIYPGASAWVELLEFVPPDATAFVQSGLSSTVNDSEVVALCEALQNFPLALQQAVAFINSKRQIRGNEYGISNYLNLFNKRFPEAVEKSLDPGYNKTILTVWDLTIDTIKSDMKEPGEFAYCILEVLAFLNPDEINVDFLNRIMCLVSNYTEEYLEEGLEILSLFSLIKMEDSGRKLSLHRLVQKVTRLRMSEAILGPQKKESNDKLLPRSIIVVTNVLKCLDISDLNKTEMSQVLRIWGHVYAENLTTVALISIPNQIVNRLIALSMIYEAVEFSESNLVLLNLTVGAGHNETLWMEHNNARALRHKGEHLASFEKYQSTYEKQKSILGEEDPCTLATAHNMAFILGDLGRYEEACEYGQRVLKSEVQVFGNTSTRTMRTRHNIAVTLNQLGEHSVAIEMSQVVLQWQLNEFGDRHRETLYTRHGIACSYFSLNKLEEAKLEFESVFAGRLEVLGDEHMLSLATKYMLAITLDRLGNHSVALMMLDEVLESQRRNLGKNHSRTNRTKVAILNIQYNDVRKYLEIS